MIRRTVRIVVVAGIFAVGFVCGSLSQRPAEAQLGDVMKQAGGAGGAVGAVSDLGTSITDMQTHLDALNKNMETLRKIKTALGG